MRIDPIKHEFQCYKIRIAPILLEYHMNKSRELKDKLKSIVPSFFIIDRVLKYIGDMGGEVTAQNILDYIKKVEEYRDGKAGSSIVDVVLFNPIESRFEILDFGENNE